jgi:hypothetical protein
MPGLVRGIARTAVIAGTATSVSNRVSRRQQGRWAQQDDAAAYNQQQQYAPAPAQAPAPSLDLDQLKELAALRDQGVLSELEFEQQKARLLGG